MSLRRRLTLTLIGLVAATAALVGTISVVLVERSMRSQRVADAVASAEFNLTVLAPAAGLSAAPDAAEVDASGLLTRFLSRGTDGVWVEFAGGERLATPGLGQVEVSDELRRLVAAGDLAYEFSEDGPTLVTAGRLPPDGPAFFFVTSTRTIAQATRQLILVVVGAGLAAVAIGALIASRLATAMLAPLHVAGQAAGRMAAGDLTVRLRDEGSDEFGRLATSFNTMASSLEATIGELEDSRARERRFVADVSHELRTPLTGLVNEAAMLKERVVEGRTVSTGDASVAALLDTDVRRLRHLVEDLLEISRLDLGAPLPPPTLVDVDAFLAALVESRHPEARLASDVTRPIETDPRALERIVGNLLDNARRHAPDSETDVSASVNEGELVIEVTDRGPGVDPSRLDQIFDRFATGDPARGGGTGLGLAIAAQHAQRMGGTVKAANRAGGGLSVTVRLPVGILLHPGDPDVIHGSDDAGDIPKGAGQ